MVNDDINKEYILNALIDDPSNKEIINDLTMNNISNVSDKDLLKEKIAQIVQIRKKLILEESEKSNKPFRIHIVILNDQDGSFCIYLNQEKDVITIRSIVRYFYSAYIKNDPGIKILIQGLLEKKPSETCMKIYFSEIKEAIIDLDKSEKSKIINKLNYIIDIKKSINLGNNLYKLKKNGHFC
jgi:hypothetical protein